MFQPACEGFWARRRKGGWRKFLGHWVTEHRKLIIIGQSLIGPSAVGPPAQPPALGLLPRNDIAIVGPPTLPATMSLGTQNSAGMSTIIVDDEKPARDELAFLLKNFPDVNVIGQGKNGLEAIALIRERNPDLAFLDVKMPGLDGFGVIRKLMERKVKLPHIVFATAYDQYAVQAFEVNAVDYVLKPFDKQRVSRAIERARRAHTAEA